MVIAKREWFRKRKTGLYSSEISWKRFSLSNSCNICTFYRIGNAPNMINNLITDGVFIFLFTDIMAASYKLMDEKGKKVLSHFHDEYCIWNANNDYSGFNYSQL
ncbi:MAG: hypothetical protein ACPK7O_03475 [Methanobacterium sp.]